MPGLNAHELIAHGRYDQEGGGHNAQNFYERYDHAHGPYDRKMLGVIIKIKISEKKVIKIYYLTMYM